MTEKEKKKMGAPLKFREPSGESATVDKVIEIRRKLNLSLKEFGEKLGGIQPSTVHSWETGQRNMSKAAQMLIRRTWPDEFTDSPGAPTT